MQRKNRAARAGRTSRKRAAANYIKGSKYAIAGRNNKQINISKLIILNSLDEYEQQLITAFKGLSFSDKLNVLQLVQDRAASPGTQAESKQEGTKSNAG